VFYLPPLLSEVDEHQLELPRREPLVHLPQHIRRLSNHPLQLLDRLEEPLAHLVLVVARHEPVQLHRLEGPDFSDSARSRGDHEANNSRFWWKFLNSDRPENLKIGTVEAKTTKKTENLARSTEQMSTRRPFLQNKAVSACLAAEKVREKEKKVK
jgi:hypothetical protein